jgi:osmotically-inducible protein OsmY
MSRRCIGGRGGGVKRSAIIDDPHVVVTNDGHTVKLTGMVGSYAAMREVVDAAWQAPGVDRVVDHLVVGP